MFFKKYFLLFGLLSLFVSYVKAESVSQTPSLKITPSVCMVNESDDTCQIELELNWQIETQQDVCLLLKSSPLKCWQQAKTGSFVYKADVQFQNVYSLVNRKTGEVIIASTVKIQSSNAKAQRRRLRSPWSFF